MSRNPLKTIVFISIGAFSFLIFGFWLTLGQPTAAPKRKPEKRSPERWTTDPPGLQSQKTTPDPLSDFQSSAFYRTIVDNNLFHPLGYRTPPRPRKPYRLLGTRTPTDGKSEAQAILQSTTTGRTDIVSLGDILDTDTTVVDIQPKQVTLEKDGHQRTLHLNTTPLIK